MSGGTVVVTGANGTLGLAFIASALKDFPIHHLILTVRNPSQKDINTAKLHALLSKIPDARYTIHTLDLSTLAAVRTFATLITTQITNGELPIAAIICNAFAWSLTSGLKFTPDGSMDKTNGRIIGMSSDSHDPGLNALEVFPPAIPADIEELAKPPPDAPRGEVGRGFQRYGVSKLCVVMYTDPALKGITAIALDPGGLPDSRAMSNDTPVAWGILMKYFLNPLQPVLKFAVPTLRKSGAAEKDLVQLGLGEVYRGANGYYIMSKPGKSSADSYDEAKCARLWERSVVWSGIEPAGTVGVMPVLSRSPYMNFRK
ncbi:hypothetical protein D9615_007245 [Tricholomella constricta]|uniref:Uncharacterized protein n=1 Tax=Tricholomella constricta TaxID=117010 RepID=A0A8H5H4M5_9AGAR|nr:hypothetical protein D9615_007245 [Tricholomella constricta]